METGSLFQWDSRSGQPPTSAPVAGSPGAAHLDVTGFTFNYVGRAFKVDSNMNLIVKRKSISNHSRDSQERQHEPGTGLQLDQGRKVSPRACS